MIVKLINILVYKLNSVLIHSFNVLPRSGDGLTLTLTLTLALTLTLTLRKEQLYEKGRF
jgi:hypothetical protein